MKERPILFSGPMVRAILEGRKTQTRRVVTVPWRGSRRALPYEPYWVDDDGKLFGCDEYGDYHPAEEWLNSPFGVPGDRLWVRETWRADDFAPEDQGRTIYAADATPQLLAETRGVIRWRPSIFMPRGRSRLTLEVVAVRVERLQEISADDVRSEGLSKLSKDGGRTWKYGMPDRDGLPGNDDDGQHWSEWSVDPRAAFSKGWDAINGKRAPWASNPWVWVVEFKVAA